MKQSHLLSIVIMIVLVSSFTMVVYAQDVWNCKCIQYLNPGCDNPVVRVIMVSGPGSDVDEQRFKYDLDKVAEIINSLRIPEAHLKMHNIQYDSRADDKNNPARTGIEFYKALKEARDNTKSCDITIIVLIGHASDEGVDIVRGSRNMKYNAYYGELALFLQSIKGHKILINGACNSGLFIKNIMRTRFVEKDGMFYYVGYNHDGYESATPLYLQNTILISATPIWINILGTQTSFVKGDDTDFIPSFFVALIKNDCDPKKAFEYESILRRGSFVRTSGFKKTINALRSLCVECK